MRLRSVAALALALAGCGSKAPAAHSESPTLAPNAPEDVPVAVTADISARVAELSAEARKTYPGAKARYLKGLPAGEGFFVVTTLRSPGKREMVFVAVQRIEGTRISGKIANDIIDVEGFKRGDPTSLDESELVDWLISKPDGSEEGNIVGKYLDTRH